MLQQNQEAARRKDEGQQPTSPKPERTLSPELQQQLEELEERLPKKAEDFGTERDQALAYVREQYEKFVKENKPALNTQMDALQALIRSDGGFDPIKYRARMEEFKARTESEGVGLYPAPIEAVRTSFIAATTDAAADSEARSRLQGSDAANFGTTFPALMRQRYSAVLEGIDAVKQQQAADRK